MINNPLSRRTTLKILAGGTALLVCPVLRRQALARETKAPELASISPIDRSLGDMAAREFFADRPELAHKVLWDKGAFIKSIGGKLPEPSETLPLVVVGGGMSGLFTSYLLREHKPLLLEQDLRFGGNSKGQSWRGIDYSIGAAYICEPEEDSDIAKVLSELGLSEQWKIKEEEDPVYLKGKIFKEFWSGETAPEAKAQFVKLAEYFAAVYEGEKYPYPEIPITDPEQEAYIKGLDKISFLEHVKKIAGGNLHPHIESAIEQYCWSSFNASSQEISAAAGLNFYAAEFGGLALLPGGNAAIAESLLTRLSKELPAGHLRSGSLVMDVRVVKDGVLVSYVEAATEKVKTVKAKVCVLATPKFVVKRILREIEPSRLAAIEKMKYRSYLVANVCLKGDCEKELYDLYMLGDEAINFSDIAVSSQKQKVTDVILADYVKNNSENTVLTLYRGMPYDGARADLYAPGAYARYREGFEKQIYESILPALGLKKENVIDLRIARWGHPLPVSQVGLIAEGLTAELSKPFKDRVFFVEQDNWALPAFETCISEALHWSEAVSKRLGELG